MAPLKERVTGAVDRVRARFPFVDHAVNTVTHYGAVNGNAQSGAVTFFGFLSFFPILALSFFFIGLVTGYYPDLRADIRLEIENLLPGVVGGGEGEIPMSTFEDYAGRVGLIGLVGVLYSGLGWLSGMRRALEVLFVMPKQEQPNFVFGKLRDLGALGLIGLTLLLSVLLTGLVTGFSERILGWLGIDPESRLPNAGLWLIAHGLAVVASMVLLLAMFRLLAQPHLPHRAMLTGALLGALGFELLKSLASLLIAQTKGQPAFQAFGVALILLVWINYFSRLVMYAAAFAYTSPDSVTQRAAEAIRAPGAALGNVEVPQEAVPGTPPGRDRDPAAAEAPLAGSHRAPERESGRPGAALAGLALVGGAAAVVAWRRSTR